MEDREFFDLLYQQFTKTTGAEHTYWMSERHKGKGVFYIDSMGRDQKRHRIASYLAEADADFITAIHGCFPELYHCLHDALDERDRIDKRRDDALADLVALAVENNNNLAKIRTLEARIAELEGERQPKSA